MRFMTSLAISAFTAAVLGSVTPAPAQTQNPQNQNPQTQNPQTRSPKNQQGAPAIPGNSGRSQDEGSSMPPGESPSNDLSRSRGVVHPPATGDQSIVQPPSVGSGSMPVIPPPGSPGGTQNVEPK